MAQDWKTVFKYQDPSAMQDVTAEEFDAWSKEKEPFIIESYRIDDVIEQDDIAWVEVDCRTSVKQYPNLPPQDTHRSEVWKRVNNEWYLVSMRELEEFPISPQRRDTEQEAELRKRAEEVGQARVARDWHRLYLLTDLDDREYVTFQRFSEAEDRIDYQSYDLMWVEVIGDRGRARTAYHLKLNDPSLSKLEVNNIAMIEQWKKIDDRWYLDIRGSSEGEN